MVGTYTFNNRLPPDRMKIERTDATGCLTDPMAPGPGCILDFDYNFNAGSANNGNVMGITNRRDGNRSQSFTYDELNRIKTAQTQATTGSLCWGQVFSYDIWANLLTIGGVSGYGACTQGSLSIMVGTNNRINSSGFIYDAAGNMTNYPSYGTYTYDAENRIVTAGGVTYTYDGDGKRVKKSNGTLYWYGAGGDVLAETDLSGVFKREYIYFNGSRTARHDAGGNWYYFADHLGSARVMTWSNGAIVEESDYYPFGGERVVTDTTNPPYDNTRKFTGQERDTESGLDYFGARYFGSTLGRLLTPDEFWKDSNVADPQSWNKYAYARNNPLKYVDPTGEKASVSTTCTTSDEGQQTCTVNITASIAIYAANDQTTQEQLEQSQEQIENQVEQAWSGTFEQDGISYTVTTDVTVTVADSEQAAEDSGAQNVIAVDGTNTSTDKVEGGSWVGGPDRGVLNFTSIKEGVVPSHEFGHLLGLDDNYGQVLSNSVCNPGGWCSSAKATAQDYRWALGPELSAGQRNFQVGAAKFMWTWRGNRHWWQSPEN